MPELPDPKPVLHPAKRGAAPAVVVAPPRVAYAELGTTSNFSFLRGASHPDELVARAAELGHEAVGIADRGSLAGIVRGHVAAKQAGIPFVVGARLVLRDAGRRPLEILAHPTSLAAYGRLCRLLTLGKRRAPKGRCHLHRADLSEWCDGLLLVALPPRRADAAFAADLAWLADRASAAPRDLPALSLGAAPRHDGHDRARLVELRTLGAAHGVPLCATNDVRFHDPARRPLQDVLACIRHGCTIESAGLRLAPNAERHLKPGVAMAAALAACPEAIARSVEVARCAAGFSLDEIRYEYPDEVAPRGVPPDAHLRTLVERGAAARYPRGMPAKVRRLVEHELALVAELRYAPYFLTVHDIVLFARSRGILCQGRGAAANSALCYCLGITAVDPDRVDLLFERFVSRERDEPPDIDVDFEHERREEVIQHVYSTYGRHRAALVSEVISYRGRSAIREVGKALGLSLDLVDRLARDQEWWRDGVQGLETLRGLGLDPDAPALRRLHRLAGEIVGFPRHLSQHVGGFVIARTRLDELVPIENAAMPDRTVIEWDKDDVDAMGMLKVDLLGLGMLTCIRKALGILDPRTEPARGPDGAIVPRPAVVASEIDAADAAGAADAEAPLALHAIPPEDPAVYDMICAADTVGVFQIESRAQMSMLPRLRPRCWYDLVIEVAIVRPGPIQGDMVHPYLRRRNGEEPVEFPNDAIRRVLERTLGVPLFQEQAMSLAVVAAGFTPGEADALRRAMAAWKRRNNAIERFRAKFIDGMLANGHARDYAERCFRQLEGFSEYGFPESHAASFALLVYASSWLKRRHPAVFATALINSLPMGFYAPAQIVRDAQDHGVTVLPVDVHESGWDCRVVGLIRAPRPPVTASSPMPPPLPRAGDRLEYTGLRRGAGRPDRSERPDRPARSARAPRHGARAAPHDRAVFRVEPGTADALRLGLRLVRGLRREHGEAIAAAVRRHGRFDSVRELWRCSGVPAAALRTLARADAFRSMGLDRQQALWQIQALRDDSAPLFESVERTCVARPEPGLPTIPPVRQVLHDYAALALSLKAHPISFLRDALDVRRVVEAAELADELRTPTGRRVTVAGLVLVRQRPATANGIVFMTIEDETGIANLILRPTVYAQFRPAARHATIVAARGTIERQGAVVHLLVRRLDALDEMLRGVVTRSRDFR